MRTGEDFDVFVSIVAPLRDAASCVKDLILEIDQTARSLFAHFEIVLVDDASVDGTVAIVQQMQQTIDNIQLYCLARRSGFEAAVTAGLDNSIGDYVFTLNPQTDSVALLPKLWSMAGDGTEVVCGVRTDRARGTLYASASRRFSSLLKAAT